MSTSYELSDRALTKLRCYELAELIGTYQWHGWSIPIETLDAWEAVLDGTYLESLGYGRIADEVAETALLRRHDAYYNHDVSACADHEMWHSDDEDVLLDIDFVY
jgi:hypothetical protein